MIHCFLLSRRSHLAWLPRGVAAPAISNQSKIHHPRHYRLWEHLEINYFELVLPMLADYFDLSSFIFNYYIMS